MAENESLRPSGARPPVWCVCAAPAEGDAGHRVAAPHVRRVCVCVCMRARARVCACLCFRFIVCVCVCQAEGVRNLDLVPEAGALVAIGFAKA